jgi:hypothetical protein
MPRARRLPHPRAVLRRQRGIGPHQMHREAVWRLRTHGEADATQAAKRPFLRIVNPAAKALTMKWRWQAAAAAGSRKHFCGDAPVAIKRPSKSLGSPVRKTVTSPGLRHVDVRVPHQMISGELYVGWLCKSKSCGRVIAIALPPPGSKPASAGSDDQLAALKCPHCGNEDLYRWSARSEHKYTTGSDGT